MVGFDKDAERVSAYLKGDDLLLLKAIKEEINHNRRIECDNYFKNNGFVKKYEPIGNSELIVQLLNRFKDTSRRVFAEKLNYHCRQAEYYENELKKFNNLKKEELITYEVRTETTEYI